MVKLDEAIERGGDVAFRQLHIDAVGQPQIPTPVRHQDRSAQRRADIRIAVDDSEKILGLAFGVAADHKGQAEIAVLDEGLEHGAVGGNHAQPAVLLPQRKSVTLGDRDLQPVRIELEHGGVGDPRICQQPLARRIGVEEQKRGAAGDAGRGEDFFAADFLLAGERDRRDAEAERVGRDIACILGPVDHLGHMLSGDRAIDQRAGNEQDRSDDAGAARQMGDFGRPSSDQPAIARKMRRNRLSRRRG